MTTAESRRHDLCNGLTEFLGADKADTLMAYIPSQESTELATKADLDVLEARLGARIDGRTDSLNERMDEMSQRLETVSQRIDRMILAMAAGLIAIIATIVTQSFI